MKNSIKKFNYATDPYNKVKISKTNSSHEQNRNVAIINKRNAKNNFMINLAYVVKVDKIHPTHEIKLENGIEIVRNRKYYNSISLRKEIKDNNIEIRN